MVKSHETQSFAQSPLAAEAAEDKTEREHIDAEGPAVLSILALSFDLCNYCSRQVRGIAAVLNFDRQPVTNGSPLAERFHVARCILKLHVDIPNFNRATCDGHFERV
jgi:hypothetical protein